MSSPLAFYRWSELDRTTFPEFREHVLGHDADPAPGEPRSYPGLPRFALGSSRPRLLTPLDRTLARRRCPRTLDERLPPRAELGRILRFAHGITGPGGRGPTPSAGGLQALELYAVNFDPGWLPTGLYHHDRKAHELSQLEAGAERARWLEVAPSLALVAGGAVLWLLVGESERALRKYAERGLRFLLLEAGHLMQNLCLLSASCGLATVPLGGFYEREIAAALGLPASDLVLYLGICGRPVTGR